MTRPVTRRSPKKRDGFSRIRFPMVFSKIVAYRLFRRDHTGAVHFEGFYGQRHHWRTEVARCLRAAYHHLRDRVGELVVGALGVAK